MAAEAERGVDQDGAGPVECGRQQGDDPVQQDRDVGGLAMLLGLPAPATASSKQASADRDRGGRGERHHGGGLARLVAHPAYAAGWRLVAMLMGLDPAGRCV